MDISSLKSGNYGYMYETMESMRSQRSEQGPPPDPPPDKVEGSEKDGKNGFLKELTSKIMEQDADEDSSLSMEELGLDEDEFSRMDADGDGLVSSDELKADISSGLDQMKAQMEESGSLGGMFAEGMVRNRAMQAYSDQLTLGTLLESDTGFGAVA